MYEKNSFMRKVTEQLSAFILFLYSIPCFSNDSYILYRRFIQETCNSTTSTQIQHHNNESTDWNKVQVFMVAVSI
jgi:hypothetical protein